MLPSIILRLFLFFVYLFACLTSCLSVYLYMFAFLSVSFCPLPALVLISHNTLLVLLFLYLLGKVNSWLRCCIAPLMIWDREGEWWKCGVCLCVCEREREIERETMTMNDNERNLMPLTIQSYWHGGTFCVQKHTYKENNSNDKKLRWILRAKVRLLYRLFHAPRGELYTVSQSSLLPSVPLIVPEPEGTPEHRGKLYNVSQPSIFLPSVPLNVPAPEGTAGRMQKDNRGQTSCPACKVTAAVPSSSSSSLLCSTSQNPKAHRDGGRKTTDDSLPAPIQLFLLLLPSFLLSCLTSQNPKVYRDVGRKMIEDSLPAPTKKNVKYMYVYNKYLAFHPCPLQD